MQICAAMALRVGKIILKVKSAARAIIINNVNHACNLYTSESV